MTLQYTIGCIGKSAIDDMLSNFSFGSKLGKGTQKYVTCAKKIYFNYKRVKNKIKKRHCSRYTV